jgi:hypothetical protein
MDPSDKDSDGLQEPLSRCLAEFGFGEDCASRAGDHSINTAINSLLAFFMRSPRLNG